MALAKETGTSLEAKGFEDITSGLLTEIGSSLGGTVRDVVPALNTRSQAVKIYSQMANGDAATDVSLRATKIPVKGAEYFFDPYDEDKANIEIQEFVSYNLLNGMSTPLSIVLEDVLRMYDYGNSVLEPVWEVREWSPRRSGANRRKYTMVKKLAPRPSPTIKEFLYDDNGGPLGLVQNAVRADGKVDEVQIDIDKLIIFTLNKQGGNLEGKSILRTAYEHWYYKTHLYKIDAIQKERHGIGIPDVQVPPGATENDKKFARALGRNLRTNEQAYIVRPQGFEVGFAKFEGELVDVMRSIEHHNSMITLNVLVQFLLLGLQGGGGRATSSSHLDMFVKSMKNMGQMICDFFNQYLIPKMVAFNFDTDKYPVMRVRNIGEDRNMQMLAAALANLAAQELITPDDHTEQWIRRTFDMPLKREPRPQPVTPGVDVVDTTTNGNANGKKGDVAKGRTKSGNMGKAPDEG